MCCILAAAGAQSITGTVTDEKYAPIAYANVVLLNTPTRPSSSAL